MIVIHYAHPASGAIMSTSVDDLSTGVAPQTVHWFRSTVFQVLVVGGVFFCVRVLL